jgi:hypothetical protein
MANSSEENDVRKPLLDRTRSSSPSVDFGTSLPAFEVSKGKRILQIIIAVIACLFAAGPVFGYAGEDVFERRQAEEVLMTLHSTQTSAYR